MSLFLIEDTITLNCYPKVKARCKINKLYTTFIWHIQQSDTNLLLFSEPSPWTPASNNVLWIYLQNPYFIEILLLKMILRESVQGPSLHYNNFYICLTHSNKSYPSRQLFFRFSSLCQETISNVYDLKNSPITVRNQTIAPNM